MKTCERPVQKEDAKNKKGTAISVSIEDRNKDLKKGGGKEDSGQKREEKREVEPVG